MSSGEEEPHRSADYKDHHKHKRNTEGGKCLWGHNSNYNRSSCSYRWQAHERAKATTDSAIYHRYREYSFKAGGRTHINTLQYETDNKGMFPSYYAVSLAVPRIGDWDVTGPSAPGYEVAGVPVTPGQNFTKDTWPYWHNAHHLIPKGTLHSCIDSAEGMTDKLAMQIRAHLLLAEYNVNHKANMMLLPQDEEVAEILLLPRHLVLKPKGQTAETTNHKQYNLIVIQELNGIISEYKEIIDRAKLEGKPHPKDKPELSKAKLEALSRRMFRIIIVSGGYLDKAGKPLSELSDLKPPTP